jgi:hypothetical protein
LFRRFAKSTAPKVPSAAVRVQDIKLDG